MENQPTKEKLNEIPTLYETDHISTKEKIIHLHFFFGASDWFIAEFDNRETFFGFVILNGDFENAEWGYISFSEIKSINFYGMQVDNDIHWDVRKASEVEKICEAQRWF